MAKYSHDVVALLEYLGGTDNIQAVSHCMTRMRFVLVDPHKPDISRIESLDSVKGTFTQAGQFQVIIGNDVAVFYNEFTAHAGIEGVSKDAVKQAAQLHQSLIQRAAGALGEIFAPIIPALICGGLILGFRNIIGEINFFNEGTASLADISQFWSGVYAFLWLIGEAVFHMLPVGIVWSITKKMGTTQILGIILGLTLVSPQLLNSFLVAGAEKIPAWDFGFIQINMIGYQSQVIAAIFAGFVLVYLEKFFKAYCPEVISMIVVPFCSLVPAVIIAHTVVGPLGWKIGDIIAQAVYFGLTSQMNWLFAAIFGFLYAPVVMTGLHHMTNAIDTQLVSLFNGTILWPMIALSNIAQGSAVLAMSVLQRRNARAQQVNVPAYISCYLGVTEPALFGVNMKYGFPLLCGMIGSACAAVISIGTGVEAYSIGVGGLPGILSIKSPWWGSFLLAMATAIVVPFVLTFIIGKRKLKDTEVQSLPQNNDSSQATLHHDETISLVAPLSGTRIELSEVSDKVFASGSMGQGIALKPTSSTVLAPFDAEVCMLMEETRHAIGLRLANGVEVLIHIGMDTVNMQGKGFEAHVRQGDNVRTGDPLITFDTATINAAGYDPTTVVIIVDPQEKTFDFCQDTLLEAGKTTIITQRS